jgi:ATP-dependent DNA helicase RecG
LVFEKWLEYWGPYLKPLQTRILLAFHDKERITKPELANLIGQGKTTIDKSITSLRSLGLLAREGSDKTGRWLINQLPAPKD